MGEVNWAQFWQLLRELGGHYAQNFGPREQSLPQPLPLQEAREPLTGFLGLQRTAQGHPASWMHMGENLGGLEWLIPLLTPNQPIEHIKALLAGLELPPELKRQIEDKAVEFALAKERERPGTFAKYGTVGEANVAATSPSKELIARPLPDVKRSYPGR